MSSLLPPAFVFRFSWPVSRVDALPKSGQRLLDLPETCRIQWPGSSLAGPAPTRHDYPLPEEPVDWLDLRLAWNPRGLAIALRVRGKRHPPASDPERPENTDGLQVWIDTRDTRTIHRASRFCHAFCLLPNGMGDDGQVPVVKPVSVGRSAEEAPRYPSDKYRIASTTHADGYSLEAWLPAETLHGFDVETCSRLGFYCQLWDYELGVIPLTVSGDFPYSSDPSLWQTLELVSEK